MKAYVVWDAESYDNSHTIVFAENARQARIAAMGTDCCEDAEYIHIRAVREPRADCLYNGQTEVNWYDTESRLVLVRDCGWMCWEQSFECDTCTCKPYCGHFEEEGNG